jgi:hypothetical protein
MSDQISQPGALGNVFGGSAAGRLSGKLPARGSKPPPAGQGQPEPVGGQPDQSTARPDQNTGQADQDTGGQPERPEPKTPAVQAATDTFQVSAYLLPDAIAAAAKVRRIHKVDNARIALDSIDRLRGELAQLRLARSTDVRPDSLFPARAGMSSRQSAAVQGRRKLWSFQATLEEIAILDRLAEEHGYSARSELISAAVEAALLPRRRSRKR